MSGDASQNQQQTQQQTVSISVSSSGDPELEQRIFSSVHSIGRQLGNLSAVLELLVAAQSSTPGFGATDAARKALDEFAAMQRDILRAKSLRNPDKLIRQLEALKQADASAFQALRQKLADFLAQNP